MKVDTIEHPKIKQLALELDLWIPTAIGLVHLMEQFTGKFCPDGAIGKYPNRLITDAMGWPESRDADELVEKLIKVRFLHRHACCVRHRLMVHDWSENCPAWVRRKLKRKDIPFAEPCPDPTLFDDPEADQRSVTDRSVTRRRPTGGEPPVSVQRSPSAPPSEPRQDAFVTWATGSDRYGPFLRRDACDSDKVRWAEFSMHLLKTLGIPIFTTLPRNHAGRSKAKSAATTIVLHVAQAIDMADHDLLQKVTEHAHAARTANAPVAVLLHRLREARIIAAEVSNGE